MRIAWSSGGFADGAAAHRDADDAAFRQAFRERLEPVFATSD
jgi:hypothetical protein